MPYINEVVREMVDRNGPFDEGTLNYALTKVAIEFVLKHGKDYKNLSTVIQAFEAAKLEFYRRVVAPYEDAKIGQNGDVYPAELVSS